MFKNIFRFVTVVFLLVVFAFTQNSFAQLTGVKTIPGDYATISAAVTDLNLLGVGSGGVTFNVAAGFTESITAPITITATGTAGNTIVFQKSGAGANPLVTRTDAGTLATTALGADGDAIFRMNGTDYITFNAIDVTASDQGIEYGYFTFKPSGTDGCQFVTISNCVITMTKGTSAYVTGINISNGPTSVSSATGVVVSAASGMNANVTINGNTVQNVHAGVYVRGATAYYDSSITVGQSGAGNIITNYGGGSATSTYGVYFIYVENPSVAYNTITSANHTSTLYGIFYSTVSGIVVGSNNSITLSNTSASSNTNGIYNANTVTTANFNNNTFATGTLSSTGTVYLIYASSSTPDVTASGNSTSGTLNRTGASGSFYCYYNLGSPASGTETLTNNNFSNITVAGSSSLYGIYSNTAIGQNRVASGNTISNLTGGTGSCYGLYLLSTTSNTIFSNNVYGITTGGTFYGLYFTGTNPTVYGNNVHNNTTSGTTMYGIYDAGTGTTNCYKNQVYNLTGTNATQTLYGFYITSGTNNSVYNNFVSDLKAPNSASLTGLVGMYVSGGTSIGLYYNSIFLNATSVGANFTTSGIYASTTPTVDLRNNVVVNASTPNGTGFTIAYRRSTTTLTSYAATSNNNDFYAGTPSASNLIFYDGTNAIQTLGDYKTLVSPMDAGSVSENPPFLNVTTAPYNLHVSTSIATQLESGGTPVTGITDDFDGDTRNVTTPDMGADEFSGIGADLTPPLISYSEISNQSYLLTSVSLTATITDVSGVASGSNSPRLYLKKINDVSYVFNNTPSVVGDDYTFTINYSAIGGVAIGDTIVYYVAAQDVPGNAGTNPAGGSGSNPPGTTPPTVPNGYLIVDVPLSGTYTVGVSAFEKLTGKKLTFETRTRTVTRDMNGIDAYEDLNANINDKENPSAPNFSPRYETVTETYVEIMENGKPFDMNFFAENPNLAAYPTITAAVTDLQLRGASGPVTFSLIDTLYASETYPIDLTLFAGASSTNTATIKPASGVNARIPGVTGQTTASIWMEAGEYYIIDGSNTVGGTTQNLTIQTVGAFPAVHFYSSGDNNIVKNCIIESEQTSTGSGVIILAAGTGSSNNLIDNCLIRQKAGGTRYSIGVYLFSTFTGTNNTISNCEFNNFNDRGITLQGGVGVDNNDAIGNIFYQATPSSAATVYGFYIGRTPNTDLIGNQIFNLSSVSASPTIYGLYEIGSSGVDQTLKLVNNVISLGGGNTAGTIRGIDYFGYSANSVEMYYNTVLISGSGVTGGTTGAVNKRDAANIWVMVDNIFHNERSNGTGTGFHYGAQFTNSTSTTWNMNYNDYYSNGTGGLLGRWGTADVDSLLEWQTATGQDANSMNLDPLLVSESDLRPYLNSPVIDAGTPVAGITTDILGATRNATTPTMGAYEEGAPLPSVLDPTDVTATAVSDVQINVAFTPNPSSNNVVIVYNLTGIFTAPTGAPPVVGDPFAGGTLLYNGLTSPYNHTGLTQVTTYYYKLFSYNGSAYSTGVTANATTQATPLSVPYSQSFDLSTMPPSWSQTSTISPRWTVNNTSNAGGSPYEMREMYASGTGISRLIVGPINTSGLTSLALEFKHFFDDYGTGITMKVQSSTDATTWTDESFSVVSGGGNQSGTVGIAINNNVGTTTYIAWVSDGNHFQFDYWYIDDVAVTIPLANDVGTFSIDIATINSPGIISPKATVKNYGTNTQSFDVQMTADGGYTSTKTVTALAPFATAQVTFDNWTPAYGVYNVNVCTQLAGDLNTGNDCRAKVVSIIDTSGVWSSGANYPVTTYVGTGVAHNGFLYSLGGNTTSTLKTECYKYEVATNTWTQIASLPAGRVVLASAAVGDFIYAIGGSDGTNYQTTVYKYDIALNTWSTVAALPVAMGWCKAVGYNNKIYVAGGVTTGSVLLSSVYVYDVTGNTWAAATSMPGVKFGGGFSVTGNKLVYVAGADAVGISNSVYVGTIDGIDPLVIVWTAMTTPYPGVNRQLYSEYGGSLSEFIANTKDHKTYAPEASAYPIGAMYRFDAAPWGDSEIIVAGGSPTAAWVPANPNPTYTYDPTTDTWIPKRTVPTAVLGSSLGTVNNGNDWKLIVASGYTGATTSIVQIYSESLGSATFQLSVNVGDGWNMVSVPGTNPDGMGVANWWPGRVGDVYKYAFGYQTVTTATPGIGYWMKNNGAQTYNTGDEWPAGGLQVVAHDPLTGAIGWNMIGGYELIVTAANVSTNPRTTEWSDLQIFRWIFCSNDT
ncbi:MAG: hypothetical protein HS131_13715 [Ignavibacteriales bacterium]|nr:hypothetical protein [Ignavibacteriales bacterium]